MAAVERDPKDISAVLVTHEHSDHAQGVGPLLRRYGMPVWMTPGTASAIGFDAEFGIVNYGKEFMLGDIAVHPFPVPHDAREPVQFSFRAGGFRLGILTDTGHVTPHVASSLGDCDAVAIEFNHDLMTLQTGIYPEALKARVASDFGHLNNHQAAALLADIEHSGLRWVVALHMSEKNNSAELVDLAVRELRANSAFDFWLATQGTPSGWFSVD